MKIILPFKVLISKRAAKLYEHALQKYSALKSSEIKKGSQAFVFFIFQ